MHYAYGMPARRLSSRFILALSVALVSAMTATLPALAQQKTGPGITGEDSLTWHGITLYGVVDVGFQFDTHSAPFTPYRPSASGNIVRQMAALRTSSMRSCSREFLSPLSADPRTGEQGPAVRRP